MNYLYVKTISTIKIPSILDELLCVDCVMQLFKTLNTFEVEFFFNLTRHVLMERKSEVFRKKHHIFGLPEFGSLFPPNYLSRIFLNYDFIGLYINIVSNKYGGGEPIFAELTIPTPKISK